MWIAKFSLKHDCIIANKCKKYSIVVQSYELSQLIRKQGVLRCTLHQLIGPSVNIRRFISALKKDKRVIHIEVNGNMMFMQETAKKQLIEYFSKEIFFVKPCVMDQKGVEHWELACPKKEVLMDFIGLSNGGMP